MGRKREHKLDACANCEQPLGRENFCPNCGQKNTRPDLHFGHFVSESLSNFFAFDSRFFNTLTGLFRRPGLVARHFVLGKRVRYMHPMRIYLLSAFVLLFVISFNPTDSSRNVVRMNEIRIGEELLPEEKYDFKKVWAPSDTNKEGRVSRMTAFGRVYPDLEKEKALDSLQLPDTFINGFLFDISTKHYKMDEDSFSKFYTSKLIWMLFLFVPILALWLKLLYIRRKTHYLEHLFFSFYTQSVILLLLVLGLLLFKLAHVIPILLAFAYFAFYLFFALRRFYGQSFWKTVLKYILINLGYLVMFVAVFLSYILISYALF